MQVVPSIRLHPQDCISLIEKALSLFGMAATVWLLVQLHQAEATHFYMLPNKNLTNSTNSSKHSANSSTNNSPKQDLTEMQNCNSNSATLEANENAIAGDKGKAAAKEIENDAVSTLELTGLSVDMSIVVVLSWAAQLVHLQDAAVVIEADSIRVNLGKFCMPRASPSVSQFLHHTDPASAVTTVVVCLCLCWDAWLSKFPACTCHSVKG